MIIGLTGKNGSGKGSVAQILMDKGFKYTSLSDVLRDQLREQNLEISRENLIKTGNHLRQTHGPSALADLISKKIPEGENYIVDSIRNPFEAKSLQNRPDFHLWCVEAPVEIRFERCLKRGREQAESTLEEFIKVENKERNNSDPHVQNLDQTEELADQSIANDQGLEELKILVLEKLEQMKA